MIHVHYMRDFCIGNNTHIIDVYNEYTDDQGLDDLVERRVSSRMDSILKGLALGQQQKERLFTLMRDREDGTVLADGSIGR